MSHGYDVLSEDSFFPLSFLVNLISSIPAPTFCLGLRGLDLWCLRFPGGVLRALTRRVGLAACAQPSWGKGWHSTVSIQYGGSTQPLRLFSVWHQSSGLSRKFSYTLQGENFPDICRVEGNVGAPKLGSLLVFLNSFKPSFPPRVLEGTMPQFLPFKDSLLSQVVLGFSMLSSAT